jgi:hypothetical protein
MSGVEGFVGGTLTSYTQTYAAQTLMGTKTATPLVFVTNDTQCMRITSSGSVGIGTSSPSSYYANQLVVDTGSAIQSGITIVSDTGNSGMFAFADGTSGNQRYRGYLNYNHSNDTLGIGTAGGESMRLDASGHLLVGTTDNAVWNDTSGTGGINLRSDGILAAARNGGEPLLLNRLGTDGELIKFNKNGTTVGSIGVADNGDRIYLAGGGLEGVGIDNGANSFVPTSEAGAFKDNHLSLGQSGARFTDIYATNGTIQTSDANEKQDIAELSEAEQRVAVAAKGLLRKFRWKDAVAEKGDEARTHFGIIAQDLQAAFAAEGLDAGDYAMFISSTWTDEDTGEERTRMGVRYSELLAFIIAAI